MLNRLWFSLKGLIGRVKQMASLFLALGTMFAPLAVVVWTSSPNDSSARLLGWIFALIGISSLVAGWVYTIKQDRQATKESERRIKAYLLATNLLGSIAEKMGVDVGKEINELNDSVRRAGGWKQ